MTYDIVSIMETFTLCGIIVSAIIFARLAVKAPNIGSFRFQLSIFILVWVVAEIPHVGQTLGFISTGSYDDLGLAIHMMSMALFSIFIGIRSVQFFNTKPFAAPSPPQTPTSPVIHAPGVLKHE